MIPKLVFLALTAGFIVYGIRNKMYVASLLLGLALVGMLR